MKKKVYTIGGSPVALKRPRFADYRVYDPQKELKKRVITELQLQHGFKMPPMTGMIHLMATFFMELPKTKAHRKHLINQIYHCYKPDLSNLIKFVEDVCVDAGIIHDDALIVEISSKKVYSEKPRTEFYFTLVEEAHEGAEKQIQYTLT